MLTKEAFQRKLDQGLTFLDGATGSNLLKMGMPRGCCTEKWVLEHPEALVGLQRSYARAGSQILYAPTFQAQPMALEKEGLQHQTELINEALVRLSRSAAADCLIAGDLTTLAAFCDSRCLDNFDLLVDNYRRQICGLLEGGADLLAAETLLYPLEAEAILCAAEAEGAACVLFSFTMQSDGCLFSGEEAGPILRDLEDAGAVAVGFNCVGADMMTPYLVTKLRRFVRHNLVCKPNAGNPTISPEGLPCYSMGPSEFARLMAQCRANGATLLGGCCGTDPEFIAAMAKP